METLDDLVQARTYHMYLMKSDPDYGTPFGDLDDAAVQRLHSYVDTAYGNFPSAVQAVHAALDTIIRVSK